jgi:dTDP-4-amino-4,6-dideoxygalactose transaminase
VDIDPVTKNISIPALERKLQIADSQGSLPHVVIPVDFAGLPCDLAEIRHLADRYGFSILEDASHATGASYLDRPVGSSYADLTVFSFHAVKVITSAEGGMVTTQCDLLAKRVRLLRSHGMTRDTSEMIGGSEGGWYYQQVDLGFNYRLTDMQAALGLSQLRRLETMHAKRLNLADRYDDCLSGLAVRRPARLPDRRSSWHLYVIELDDPARRRATFEMLREQGIGVNVHYIPIHTQPYYRRLGFRTGDFPNAERYYSGALSIPLHPRLTEEQQNHVTETLYKALA